MHWNEEFIQDLCACVKIKILEILASVRVSWRIRANACVSSLMRETWQLCTAICFKLSKLRNDARAAAWSRRGAAAENR